MISVISATTVQHKFGAANYSAIPLIASTHLSIQIGNRLSWSHQKWTQVDGCWYWQCLWYQAVDSVHDKHVKLRQVHVQALKPEPQIKKKTHPSFVQIERAWSDYRVDVCSESKAFSEWVSQSASSLYRRDLRGLCEESPSLQQAISGPAAIKNRLPTLSLSIKTEIIISSTTIEKNQNLRDVIRWRLITSDFDNKCRLKSPKRPQKEVVKITLSTASLLHKYCVSQTVKYYLTNHITFLVQLKHFQ